MYLGDHRDFLDFTPFQYVVRTECGISWNDEDIVRFLRKVVAQPHPVDPNKVCLIFTGGRSRGQGKSEWYGSFWTRGKTVRAHKFAAVAIMGMRPRGNEQLDHTCANTRCVSCLEVVTPYVNWERSYTRGNRRKR